MRRRSGRSRPALLPADLGRFVTAHPGRRGGLEEKAGEERIRGGSSPSDGASAASEYRCWGRPTPPVASVRTSSRPDVAHALEVRPDGVRVEPQRLRDVGRRERHGRAGELEIDRVAGVVAERLEDRQPAVGHDLKITRRTPVKSVVMPAGSPSPPHSPPSVEEIFGLLRGVMDPELGGNVVDLGMIPSVDGRAASRR